MAITGLAIRIMVLVSITTLADTMVQVQHFMGQGISEARVVQQEGFEVPDPDARWVTYRLLPSLFPLVEPRQSQARLEIVVVSPLQSPQVLEPDVLTAVDEQNQP
jgi:hypothetical protein